MAKTIKEILRYGSETHRKVLAALDARWQVSDKAMAIRQKAWRKSEEQYAAYMPEKEADRLRREKREDGEPQYTTLVIPYSYAIMMTVHTYWTTVFLSRSPVFQFEGRHGETEQQIQALEAIMAYQVQVGEQLVPLYVWLLDTAKYGIGIVGNYWEDEVSQVSEEMEVPATFLGMEIPGRTRKEIFTRKVRGYQGNKLFNIRPYDWFPDTRVPLAEFQRGEFCGDLADVAFNTLQDDPDLFNLDVARRTRRDTLSEREQSLPPNLELPATEDEFYSEIDLKDVGVLSMRQMYVELSPVDWGLSDSRAREKWSFLIANKSVIVGAEPLGCDHNRFPYAITEYESDGYALAKRSLLEILKPLQDTLDWMVNTYFHNVRKSLNDMFIVDPSLIMMKDMTDPLPGKLVRLRPRGYGGNFIDKAVKQLTVMDITKQHLQTIPVITDIMQRVSGATDNVMGLLNPGGRKTATEVRSANAFGTNRLKTSSEFFSAQGWAPLAQLQVQMTQQKFDEERQFKVAGDLFRLGKGGRSLSRFLNVTPNDIRGFYDFVPVDGTMPVDRFAQANLWRELLSMIAQVPPIAAQYDLGGIFAWIAQLSGLKNIQQFRFEITPEEALAAQVTSGNVVPIGEVAGGGAGRAFGGGEETASRVPEPGQLSGMGTTG